MRLLKWTAFYCVAFLLGSCSQRTSHDTPALATAAPGSFPAGFLWGTATAGFQVESGCPSIAPEACEDHHSDWYQFVTDPDLRAESGLHLSGQDVSAGPGFYELYDADLTRARTGLSNNAVRVGVEWSRIFPSSTRGITGQAALRALANPDALTFYRNVFTAARAKGLEVMVTVNHYTLPLWIHDGKACHLDFQGCTARGWADATMVDELAKFSGFVAAEFGDVVDLWATQNEPLAVLLPGYVTSTAQRSNPPAVVLQTAAARAVAINMQVAHARQYDAIKAGDRVDANGDGTAAGVGLVYNLAPAYPRNPASRLDVQAAQDANYLYNEVFLNSTIKGDFDAELNGVTVHRDDLAGRMDFLGINYYTRILFESTTDGSPVFPDFSSKTTFNPFTIEQGGDYPRGIYEVCMKVKAYGIPLIITENGAEDPQDNGHAGQFMVEHLTWLSRAMAQGANVQGYFWWTLMDNYEWNHGMDLRMGLYAVDNSDPQKIRTARAGVATYQRIAAGNSIPVDLMAQYPVAP